MSTIDKKELLNDVRNIINEGFNKESNNYDNKDLFNIRKYVNELIEEGHRNPDLMNYLIKYEEALNQGIEDFKIFEQFGQGLVKYSKGNPSVKAVIKDMNKTLAENCAALVGFQLIENISDPYMKDELSESFNNYLNDKCDETKNEMIERLEPLLMASNPVGLKLNILLTEDTSISPNFIHTDYVEET